LLLQNLPKCCPRKTLRPDTASNFEAEKEDEDREDDGEDESLESICGDDLLRVNFLAHTDLTHENVSRKFLRHLGFESSILI